MQLISRAKKRYKQQGICYVMHCAVRKTINPITNFLEYYFYKISKSSRTFLFQGETYRYFYHKYNKTWKNERAVDIPIIWEIVKKSQKKRILEVGNVLSHYFPANHDIVDKYELAKGVINQDIVDFTACHKYDLIVSISTLEHVGYDEKRKEPGKILFRHPEKRQIHVKIES